MDARPGPIARSVPALPNFRRRRVRAAGRPRGCRAPPVQPSRARHRNGTAPAGGSVRSCAGTPSSRNRLSKWPGVITPRITAPSLSTRNVCGTPRGMYTVVPGPAVSSRSSIQNVTAPGQHGLHRHRSVVGEGGRTKPTSTVPARRRADGSIMPWLLTARWTSGRASQAVAPSKPGRELTRVMGRDGVRRGGSSHRLAVSGWGAGAKKSTSSCVTRSGSS